MSLGTTSTQAMWGTKKYLIMLYCVFLSLPLSIYVLHVVGMSSKAIYLQATNDCQKQLKKIPQNFWKKIQSKCLSNSASCSMNFKHLSLLIYAIWDAQCIFLFSISFWCFMMFYYSCHIVVVFVDMLWSFILEIIWLTTFSDAINDNNKYFKGW